MPDVMKVLAKDPFVPSVFENFKEASITSWWKLGLRMGFPEGMLQFALSFTSCVQLFCISLKKNNKKQEKHAFFEKKLYKTKKKTCLNRNLGKW